jgi:hypothetical protein
MDVNTSQVGGPVEESRVQVGRARRGVLRPGGLIPLVPPHRLARMGRRVVRDHLNAVRARRGRPQVQAAERQAGRAQVDVAVHESRSHEATVEIDHFGAGELTAADVISA